MNIKERIQRSGVYQWQVAEKIGIGEVTLVRWLRRPEKLDPERLARIERALEELLRERGEQR
jgi:DNA-binding transcriptional regulator YdaS (Cro superfamily)